MTFMYHDYYDPHELEEPSRRRNMRIRREGVAERPWRHRTSRDVLPDFTLSGGKTLEHHQRCGVLGLPLGDCQMERFGPSAYCGYHQKLAEGLLEPTDRVYPVWPLPPGGYVFTDEEA